MSMKFKRILVQFIFNRSERDLIEEAVLSHTDYPDDVAAEHVGDDWYEKQQAAADKIATLLQSAR